MSRDTILETVIDIALNAGCLIETGEIEVDDSRLLVQRIQQWATEFVAKKPQTEDYIGDVDRFAYKVLKSTYPRSPKAFD
ncbi:hypothetical protein PV433_10815 [Paenibacillus sp. GYB004]|uniref:hypothetical protein n=1 Tax=Paenibacillus sp. GYB004 TaxID=2994393 RepID=UPI002F96B7F0